MLIGLQTMQERTFHEIKGLILDMDGVLWHDQEPVGDLPAIFNAIRARGWQVILVTNNATLTAAQFAEKLGRFGVQLDSRHIVNSAQATAEYLQARRPQGGPVFVIGEQGLLSELAMKGFYPDEEEPLAVVVGLDRTITYEKLRIASRFVPRRNPFCRHQPR